jgi:hypothetical protein
MSNILNLLLYNSPNDHETREYSITACFIPKKFDPRISQIDKISAKTCLDLYASLYGIFLFLGALKRLQRTLGEDYFGILFQEHTFAICIF